MQLLAARYQLVAGHGVRPVWTHSKAPMLQRSLRKPFRTSPSSTKGLGRLLHTCKQRVIPCHLVEKRLPVVQWEFTRYTRRHDVTEKGETTEDEGGPMSVDPVFEITDPDEPCDCGCGMAEGDR